MAKQSETYMVKTNIMTSISKCWQAHDSTSSWSVASYRTGTAEIGALIRQGPYLNIWSRPLIHAPNCCLPCNDRVLVTFFEGIAGCILI